MKKKTIYIIKSIIAVILLSASFDGFAYASSGTLCGNYIESHKVQASMAHDYSSSRYCELSISTGSTYIGSTTIGFASGVLSPNNLMSLTRTVNGNNVYAAGVIYNGQVPYSGVVWSDHIEVE